MRLFTTLWVMPNLAPTSRSESPSKKIACISSCSLSDSKGRAAFSLSTMTALTTVSAMSTASSVIKSRGFPSLSVNPSRDALCLFHTLYEPFKAFLCLSVDVGKVGV